MDKLKKMLGQIQKAISILYQKMCRDWQLKQRQEMLQKQEQAVSMGQIYMQEALGMVLASTHILPCLTAVEHPTDLIPDSYQLGDVPVYSYRWLKRSPEAISTTVLNIAVDKINSAVHLQQRKLACSFQTLPDYQKPFFIQQYPAFYNGFHVIGLKDAGTDVIISAVYD